MNNKVKVLVSVAVFFVLLLSIYFLFVSNPFTESEDISSESNNDTEEVNTETDLAIYRVREGDTLESIASEYGLEVESIVWANNLGSYSVRSGQTLVIPPVDGISITVEQGDTLESVSKEYSVSEEDIADFNWLDYPFDLEVGQKIFIPGGKKL